MCNKWYLALLTLLTFLPVLLFWTLLPNLCSVSWTNFGDSLLLMIQNPWFVVWGPLWSGPGSPLQTHTSLHAGIDTESVDQLSCPTHFWVYGFHNFVAFLYLKLPHYLYSCALLHLPTPSLPPPLTSPPAQITLCLHGPVPQSQSSFSCFPPNWK